MTENRSTPHRTKDEGGQQAHKARRLIWIAGAVVAALVVMTVYVNLGHSRPLRISKETTYITEPLKSDGKQVDYFAAIRQATRPDSAATDENGYRLIVRHFGPGPDETPEYFALLCEELGLDARALRPDTQYQEPHVFLASYVQSPRFDKALFDQLPPEELSCDDMEMFDKSLRDDVAWMLGNRLRRPWTLDELPMMAEWLAQSEPALDLIGRAVRQPTFYVPLTPPGEGELLIGRLPAIQDMRSFARGLRARANYRTATGDIDGAIDDMIACKRLGRHVGSGPSVIDLLVGIALEEIAGSIGIAGSLEHPPTDEQLSRWREAMDRFPRPNTMQDKMLLERFFALDMIQAVAHGQTPWQDARLLLDRTGRYVTKLGVDWNVVARRFNGRFDEAQATGIGPAMVSPTLPDVISFVSRRARSEFLGDVFGFQTCFIWEGFFEATRGIACSRQMQRITLAMLLYERDHGTLPPAWSTDADGNPLHSWRVLLLPYLGHSELHERIRLDEPWDSEHNRQFHGEAVDVFRCPSHPAAGPGETTYSVVVGPDMPFEAGVGKRLADFGPHSDDMILLVERTDPVGWMDPAREITQAAADEGIYVRSFGPSPPGAGRIGSHHPDGASFGFRNGAVYPLSSLEEDYDEFGSSKEERRERFKRLLRGTNAEKTIEY